MNTEVTMAFVLGTLFGVAAAWVGLLLGARHGERPGLVSTVEEAIDRSNKRARRSAR